MGAAVWAQNIQFKSVALGHRGGRLLHGQGAAFAKNPVVGNRGVRGLLADRQKTSSKLWIHSNFRLANAGDRTKACPVGFPQ
jgi:hypothetical protein